MLFKLQMSIQKIEPTTKVKEWVKRINLSFDEIRRHEIFWTTTSVVGQSEYEFEIATGDPELAMKRFDPNAQYSVQYGGVILVPEDYSLSGNKLTFVNGPAMENGYPIIVRYIARGVAQGAQQ